MATQKKMIEYNGCLIRPDRDNGVLSHTVIYKNIDNVPFCKGWLSFREAKKWINDNTTNGIIN
jgi:hypothetical protein